MQPSQYAFEEPYYASEDTPNTTAPTGSAKPQPAANSWTVAPAGATAHTGFPNPGIEAGAPELDFNRLLIQHSASTFVMRIAGDSWQALGIFDNDIAVIDRALNANANDLTVWWQGGEFSISPRWRLPPEATS
ncbi:MAG TPA: S24 family peptidase, partial [Hymenobacter sp.]